MSAENTAVFLSYASQDAEAARRICDALRAAGVEVWFDQSELRGGDSWDTKIRKQIKECALFVPIISANTQARTEGYFRREWRLAVERMHDLADDHPFLMPIVIDDTADAAARVPERFRERQWTRLRQGCGEQARDDAAVAAFCQRINSLLSHPRGAAPQPLNTSSAGLVLPPGRIQRSKTRPRALTAGLWAGALLGISLAVLLIGRAVWPPATNRSADDKGLVSASRREADALVAKAWEHLEAPGTGRPGYEVASDYCRRATELEPDHAAAWAAWSHADTYLFYHGYDGSAARREAARTKAARALKLAPLSYEARLSEVCYLVCGTPGASGATATGIVLSAEATLRELVREKPADSRAYRVLAVFLRNAGRAAEAVTTLEQMAANRGSEGKTESGWVHFMNGNYADAQTASDQRAKGGLSDGLLLRLHLALYWAGDLDLAKKTLDEMPPAELQEDAIVVNAARIYWWRREPREMLRLLEAAPRDWLGKSMHGPKAYLVAEARELLGSREAAIVSWRQALRVVDERLAAAPDAPWLNMWRAQLLARLGQREEAKAALRLADSLGTDDENSQAICNGMTVELALGDPDAALARLGKMFERKNWVTTAAMLRLDPSYDSVRRDPRFQALLARAEADPRRNPRAAGAASAGNVPPPEKSVAVLAFRPGGADRENDLLSEAIPDELRNVLGQVPGLRVAASASAFSFKGKGRRLRDIGGELGVAYLVDGSVVKVGNRVRVRAELIRAADEARVWTSALMERELKDMFAVQDDIVPAIAENLHLQLGTSPPLPRTVHPEAYALYQTGRQQWNLRHEAAYVQAEAAFTRALGLDPQFALGYAGLADVWLLRGARALEEGEPSSDALNKAESFARRALDLDPDRPDSHATLGTLHMFRGEKAESRAAFERALGINESYATAHHWYAMSLFRSGRVDLALRHALRAAEADPLSPVLIDVAVRLSFAAGAYREVERHAQRRQLMPRNPAAEHVNVDGLVWRARHRLDRTAEAAAWGMRVVTEADEGPGLLADALIALVEAGRRDEAAQGMEALRQRNIRPALLAPVLAALGRNDDAIAAAQHTVSTPFGVPREKLFYDPAWDALRNDSRFQALLVQLNAVEDYQVARETLGRLQKEGAAQK